ncbi:Fatty-acid peroxygenase [Corynebacterium capitovis DSM 44611]|uniref:cytochrome P450 n=1 Tax=Corynebacterium capitovis TaxID=131081 RepID=UPI000366C267|nr:cytochrome P450 [Corynebacterium capitovis]WKD57960.1 Fatty-acid peroxygenase [Corynebacterium capitovis DSM 44611]
MSEIHDTPHRVPGEHGPRFVTDGYLWASNLRKDAELSPDSQCPVTTTLLGADATLIRGADAVSFFYDESVIKREGAMPRVLGDALVGKGAVHSLDGEEHKARKAQMADMAYEDDRVAEFAPLVSEEVDRVVADWSAAEGNVFADLSLAFGRAAFRWAGIELPQEKTDELVRRMTTLLDTVGKVAGTPKAFWQRNKLDSWAEQLITDVREGRVSARPDSVLEHMANLTHADGSLVDAKTAGVDLQNLTRPTVAVGIFASFAAVALAENPAWRQRIHQAVSAHDGLPSDVREAIAFAQEVRRFYPFVPMFPAKALSDTEFKGCPIREGQRVLLDFVGTLHEPGEWDNPATFDPERFMPYATQAEAERITTFIPQGGADVRSGHRCPGEKIAVTALSTAVAALARPEIHIGTEASDTYYSMTKVLTRPESGVRVTAG